MLRHLFVLLLAGAFAAPVFAQPYGIETRLENTELLISELPPSSPGQMNLQPVYTNLQFQKALLMLEAPDTSGRFFVASQSGWIDVFDGTNPNVSTKTRFLDISSRVYDSGERGLLGLAFSPDYAASGEFYVSYVTQGGSGVSRLSRFVNANPAGNSVDGSPGNEEILFELSQPYGNHNGGMIAFGPDNMLYFGLGDGGSGGDPGNRAQDTTNYFGSMLRIDVLSVPAPGEKYVIPSGNPFFGGGPAGAATLPEIYAYGLRNPWRFSFDMVHGYLFAGDVGQNAYEEITVIRPGENHGWRIMEGTHCYNPPEDCDQTGLILPIVDYGREVGQAVTGGYVYYGEVDELYGKYLYGDYSTGIMFALDYDGTSATTPVELGHAGFNIAGFGQDNSGEVYVLEFTYGESGGIYTFTPANPSGSEDFPTRLSDMPALLAAGFGQGHTVDGVIPYEPSAKLWSDGTAKDRYIALPGLAEITFQLDDGWDFPEETVLIKNFLMPLDRRDPLGSLKRIETRLLIKKDGGWHGFSYEWNDAETDALLLTTAKEKSFAVVAESGASIQQTWLYPSRNQCLQCHTAPTNGVLGLTTKQLNYDFTYPASGVSDNQLRTLDHISIFTEPLPDTPANLPKMPDSNDETASIHDRARAYLAANCSMCHRPASSAPTAMDLRWEVSVGEMGLVGEVPQAGDLGIPGALIVKPGAADQSVLLERMKVLDENRMPPLASSVVDDDGVAVIREWINSLDSLSVSGWHLY